MKRESCITSRPLFAAAMGLTLVWLVTPAVAQNGQVKTFAMPACPIKAHTVPPTKTEIKLPDQNPPGETLSVGGTVQVTDQTSSTVFLTQYAVLADTTRIAYARIVKTLAHETGSLTFDHGCTSSDSDLYGSNNCAWTWGDSITEDYQGALQEDITAGKIIVNLTVASANEEGKLLATPTKIIISKGAIYGT
jgi:hypothetical protein